MGGKFPIKCSVTYDDLSGRTYGIDYQWWGQGQGKNPSQSPIKLRGEYLKFKQP